MAKRYFEYIGEDAQRGVEASSKFWEVEQDEKKVVVRFGKIGAKGQTTEKEFSTSDEAAAHVEKLVSEKVKKGYQEK